MQNLQNEAIFSSSRETCDIETSSLEYARRFQGNIGEYFLRVQSKITLEMLKPYSNANVLDIGGGHAQVAAPLVKLGYKVTVTGSANSCRETLDKVIPSGDYDYLTCDNLNLPFEDSHFDAVLAFRLLPHVVKWRKLISEMCRVSKHIIILDYPDIRSINFLYPFLFSVKKVMEGNTRPYRLFKSREILQAIHEQNFDHPILKPEFFVPMVLHRELNSVGFSKAIEFAFRAVGFTQLFGSPVILKATKLVAT